MQQPQTSLNQWKAAWNFNWFPSQHCIPFLQLRRPRRGHNLPPKSTQTGQLGRMLCRKRNERKIKTSKLIQSASISEWNKSRRGQESAAKNKSHSWDCRSKVCLRSRFQHKQTKPRFGAWWGRRWWCLAAADAATAVAVEDSVCWASCIVHLGLCAPMCDLMEAGIDTQTNRQTQRPTNRPTNTQTNEQTNREIDRNINRQTGKQRDRPIGEGSRQAASTL